MIHCQKCGKKFMEFLEGRAIVRCPRCKTVNILHGSVNVEKSIA